MDASPFPNLDPELAPILELLPDMTRSMEDIASARAMLASFLPAGAVPGEELLDITRAAEWVLRVVVSLVTLPGDAVDADDPASVNRFVREFLVPGLS